jgi:hypothetical protein
MSAPVVCALQSPSAMVRIRRAHATRPARLPRHVDEHRGAGPWAVVAPCNGYTVVSRYQDRAQADRVMGKLTSGCGAHCWPGEHRLVGPLAD